MNLGELSAIGSRKRASNRASLEHPVDEVWALFADTGVVASCVPGATLTGDASARNISGKMRVKVGPIAAEFHGTP